jgi:lysozyme
MTLDTAGKQFLRGLEGLKLTAYNLGDGWTIGHGNKYYENGQPVKQGDTITKERAATLFDNIAANFAKQVSAKLKKKVSQGRFTSLVSYAYNRGIANFNNSNLLKMVNANPDNKAIPAQFIKEWGTNNTYKDAIILRRKKEAALYEKSGAITDVTYLLLIPILIIIYKIFNSWQTTEENQTD